MRRPYAHVKVKKIDTSAALKRAGVRMGLTGKDFVGKCLPRPLDSASAEGSSGGAGVAAVVAIVD